MRPRNHVIIDRAGAILDTFPGTARFVCGGCRFSTNKPQKAEGHLQWVKDKVGKKTAKP